MAVMSHALLLLLPLCADAQIQMRPSLTMDLLQNEAAKDPSSAGTSAAAKDEAADGFSGQAVKGVSITPLKPVGYTGGGEPAETKPAPKAGGRDSYHFQGQTPIKGISIYTPIKDERGDEGNGTPTPPADPLAKLGTYKKIAGGAGGALLAGGIIAAAVGGPVGLVAALFLGAGVALGVFGALWLIGRKLKPKD